MKCLPILIIPLSSNLHAEPQTDDVVKDSSQSVLRLDSMAVTAPVAEATLGGISIKQLPLASTIINQDEIKRLKFVRPDELLDRIPGETQIRNLRIPAGDKSYTIPLIDGAALGSPLSGSTQKFGTDVNPQDIERIEIIKGPTSALFPNNAFGGVINVVTKGSLKMPKQNTRFWVEAGNYDRYRGGVNTQGELKGVGYLFHASSWNLSAFRDQARVDVLDDELIHEVGQERHQASGKLIFHPDDVSSLMIRGMYLKDHSTDPGELFQSEFDADDKQIGRQNGFFANQEAYMGAAIYERDLFSDGHLTANFNIQFLDQDGVSRFGGANDDTDVDINGKVLYKHNFTFLDSNVIFGTDIYHGTNDDFNPHANSSRTSRDDDSTSIYAGFAQIQFWPIENVQVTAGVRHETIELDHKRTSASGLSSSQRISFAKTLPKVGISYDYFEDHRVWFAYGEGFLVPTVGQLYTARRGRANADLKPEEAQDFEVGLRGRLPLFNSDLTYDISYYHTEIENFIVASQINSEPTKNLNAGKVTVQGVESVVEYQPFDFLRLGVTYTFQNNIFNEFIDGTGADLSGEELNRSPEHHINGRIAVMPMEGLAIELGIDSQTSYTTAHNSRLDSKGRFDRDERINLRVTYDKGPLEVWFHALNIGDVKEDRVGYSTRSRQRSIRTVDGLQLYGGIAYNF